MKYHSVHTVKSANKKQKNLNIKKNLKNVSSGGLVFKLPNINTIINPTER